jgi:hypothetical protein
MQKDLDYYREGGDLIVLVEQTLFRVSSAIDRYTRWSALPAL